MENKHINEESFKHMEHFHDIALRILLIDDKVGQDNKDRFISLVEENEINKNNVDQEEEDKKESPITAFKRIIY